jgi:hypothetical protein
VRLRATGERARAELDGLAVAQTAGARPAEAAAVAAP